MIRIASPDDARQIREIYRPAVEVAVISFEVIAPTVEQMQQRIENSLPNYPWLVDEWEGRIRGFAYAGPFHLRAGYRWTAESTIYVDSEFYRQGIARNLCRVLLEILRAQGLQTVIAGIALPNTASVQLHESLGFMRMGVFPRVGYKHDAWHDVGWWYLPLTEEPPAIPAEPTPFGALAEQYTGDLTRSL